MYKTNDISTVSDERSYGGNLNMDLVNFEDVAHVTTDEYFNNNQMCINVFQSKYAHYLPDQDRKETPPEVFKRNARELSRFEPDSSYEKIWFSLMYNDWFRPGGSIISGLGSGRNESLLNCSTLPINGDSLEDIAETEYSLMKCAAFRQGIGIDLSALRCRGSKVGNAAEESMGTIPWGKKFSNVGLYVGQRGRMPALLESLLISHPDIEEFITSKMNKGELENCNISVQITDDFMDCLRNGKPWKLHFSTHRDSFEKEIDPEYLIDLIADTASKSAEPGVQFIDLMRSGSMVHSIYKTTGDERFKIISSNACCLPESERIFTNDGIITVGEIKNNKNFNSITDEGTANIEEVVAQGVRPIYNLKTKEGVELKVTDNHKIKTKEGFTEVKDLQKDQKLKIPYNDVIDDSEVNDFYYKLGFILGFMIGDGYLASQHKTFGFSVSDDDPNTYEYLKDCFLEVFDYDIIPRTYKKYGCSQVVATSANLYDKFKEYGLFPCKSHEKEPPEVVFYDPSILKGFMSGLFQADGCVNYKHSNSLYVSLDSSSFKLTKEIQQLLLYFGIRSMLYENRRNGKTSDYLPDSQRESKLYNVKEITSLRITSGDIKKFNEHIGFINGSPKDEKINDIISTKNILPSKNCLTFVGYEYVGEEPVYDLVNSSTKTFTANGIVVSNSEKPLPPYGCCNLGSINMEKFSTDPKEYKNQLAEIVPYLVRLLDDVVDYEIQFNKSPLEKQKWILEQTRELGLGITNLHGWFLKQDIQYDSDEAINKAEDFFKTYVYYIFKTSVELGREKGSAPAFTSAKDLYENSTYFKNVVDEFYDGDYTQIDALRNLAHISIAPTGSLSNTFSTPCIASGVEPIIGPYYWRKTRAVTKGTYEYYFVIPERVKEYVLKQIPEDSEDYQKLSEFTGSVKDDDGKIGKEYVELLQKYISDEFFKPAHQIDYYKKIDLMSKLYQFTDAAISNTFNLPPSATKDDVQNVYLYAYDKGVKAVSVYVEGSREGILIFDDPVTHKNKQDKQNLLCLDRPEDIPYHCAPKRPQTLECDIHHCTVKGEKWLVLIGMFNGKPYELFCGTQEDLYLPRSVTTGYITKDKGQYNLSIQNKRTNVEYKNIADILMTAEQKALTRMISLSLRHGVPLEFITKQLRKSKNDITDFASAVSRVLGKYETQDVDEGEKCPKCGELMIKREGCVQCSDENCGYSKCS